MSYATVVPASTSKPGRGGFRKGAGRPPAADPLRSTGFRLPSALLARLDAVLDPGEDRSAFARAALESAIVERERLR